MYLGVFLLLRYKKVEPVFVFDRTIYVYSLLQEIYISVTAEVKS